MQSHFPKRVANFAICFAISLITFPTSFGGGAADVLSGSGFVRDAYAQSKDFETDEFWQESEKAQEKGGYWFTSFLGGVAVPGGEMGEVFNRGLAANLRFGYTGKLGLGLSVGATYSPLPKKQTDLAAESHLGLITALPRFTLGRNLFRMWFAAGGGVALQRTDEATGAVNNMELIAAGEAGFEMFVFSSGGIALLGNYSKGFGQDIRASLFSLSGGLVFSFE